MAISALNSYRDVAYQWQGQQLRSTGTTSGSKNATSTLFDNNTSMIQQVSSMLELTKYAMDQMGVSGDSRVTFAQITKYREQLQSEFNSEFKQAILESGIQDIASLGFTLGRDDSLTVSGGSATDRKKAQQFLSQNPGWAKEIRARLDEAGVEKDQDIEFKLSSSGRLTAIDRAVASLQDIVNGMTALTDEFRSAMAELGVSLGAHITLRFDAEANLIAEEHPHAADIDQWLADNRKFASQLADYASKNGIELSAISLDLDSTGSFHASINNPGIKEIQDGLDNATEVGSRLYSALSNLTIDQNASFSLQVNDDGSLNIISDHPDADKIRQIFAEHPELTKLYRQIEALKGIDDARKAMQISPNTMRKRIQIESLASWWNTSDSAASYFGQYSGDGLSLFSGLNMSV